MEPIQQPTTFYSHLVCSKHGDIYDKNGLHTFSKGNKLLLAQYVLSQQSKEQTIDTSLNNMWRYRPLLPIEQEPNIVTLGEGMTPLIPLDKLAQQYDVQLLLKDESYNF